MTIAMRSAPCLLNSAAAALPGHQPAAVHLTAALDADIVLGADAHDPAEGVVEGTVVLKAYFLGDLRQRGAFAHQQRSGVDALFVDVELQRAAGDAFELGDSVIDDAQFFRLYEEITAVLDLIEYIEN